MGREEVSEYDQKYRIHAVEALHPSRIIVPLVKLACSSGTAPST